MDGLVDRQIVRQSIDRGDEEFVQKVGRDRGQVTPDDEGFDVGDHAA